MRINKATVLSVALSGLMLAQGVMASPAMAASASSASYQEQTTHIYLNGKEVITAFHIDATDPYSHKATSWMPIWYLEQTLTKLGVQSTWDGSTWKMSPPSTWKLDVSSAPQPTKPKSSQMAITIANDQFVLGPKIVAPDPWGHVLTTYVPIYYVMEGLQRMGISYTWDGTNLKLTQTKNG